MDLKNLPDNPYLLLTPGPLSTTKTVKAAMLRDWCTWDDDYKKLVQDVRTRLVKLATDKADAYTTVLMQGSGTFCVEAAVSTVVPADGSAPELRLGRRGPHCAGHDRRPDERNETVHDEAFSCEARARHPAAPATGRSTGRRSRSSSCCYPRRR